MHPFSLDTWIKWKAVINKGCDLYADNRDNTLVTTIWSVLVCIKEWHISEKVGDKWKAMPRPQDNVAPSELNFHLSKWLSEGEPIEYILEHINPDPKVLPEK